MRVRATRTGYYDLKRRKEGEVFNVPDKLFSKKWMENLDAIQEDAAPAKAVEAKAQKPLPSREVI